MKNTISILYVTIIFSLLSIPALAQRVELRLSGILGQSQVPGSEPCPFVGSSGLAIDQSGRLWTAYGDTLYGFSQSGAGWTMSDKIQLPSAVSLGIRWDGKFLYAACYDGKIHKVDLGAKTVTPVFSYGEKTRTYAVAPAGLSAGFAKAGKFYMLEGATVSGYAADGTPLGAVLNLTLPEKAGWWYCSIGVEPNTGDLLVGSYYPDITVYRFKADGQQVVTDGWPRRGVSVDAIVNVGNTAWALCNAAVSLPNILKNPNDVKVLPQANSYYNNGLIIDAKGNYWMSTTQGIIQFDPDGQPTHNRIGGITGVNNMAVLANGTLLGSIENKQRLFRMSISDDPNTALISGGNEPWRVAGNWSSTQAGIVADGTAYIVLDEQLKQLCQYDPERTDGPVWTKLTEANTFVSPHGLAMGDSLIWVLDGKRLLEIRRTGTLVPAEVKLPVDLGIESIASESDKQILVADKSSVSALARTKDGAFQILWKSSKTFSNITSLAVAGNFAFVLDKDSRTVYVLSIRNGEVVAEYKGDGIAGGFEPTAIAAVPRWLFIADETGKRILRLKIL